METFLSDLSSKHLRIKDKSEILANHFKITLCNTFNLAECIIHSTCKTFLLTGHIDGTIQKWVIKSPGKNVIVASHSLKILCLTLNEQFLASSGQDGILKIWKMPLFDIMFEYYFQATCIKFLSSPYECLACSNSEFYLKINLKNSKKIDFTQKFSELGVSCLVFLQSRNSLFIGFDSGVGKIIEATNMSQTGSDLLHEKTITCACEYETKLITASMDQSIRLWSIDTQEIISKISTDTEIYINLEVYKGYLIVTSMKKFLTFISLESFEIEDEFDLEEPLKCSVLLEDSLFYSGNHRNLRSFNLKTLKKDFILSGHKSNVVCLSAKPSDNIIATGGRDNTIRVWDLTTSKQVHVLYGHASLVRFLNFTLLHLVSISDDKTLKIWDYQQEILLHSILIPSVNLKIPENLGFRHPFISLINTNFSYQLLRIDNLKSCNVSRKYILLLNFRSKIKIR